MNETTVSSARLCRAAKKLVTRMRMTKMRTAARLAGQLATTQKELMKKEQGEEYDSGSSSEEESNDED